MEHRSKRLIEALIVTIILGGIFYIARPIGPTKKEIAKLEQTIPPLDCVDMQISVILQDVVDSVEVPIEIEMCTDLVERRISIRTEKPVKLRDVLKEISSQTNREIVLFRGIEGTTVRPIFLCLDAPGDFKVIQKRK